MPSSSTSGAGSPDTGPRGASAHVVVADLDDPVVSGEDLRHLSSVLRLRKGETVGATDGAGGWRPCRWAGAETLEADGEVIRSAARVRSICVAFAPVKGDRNDWAVQKLTEFGVDRIVLLGTERSVVRWAGDRASAHIEKLRRVARQALMQSRGVWMPRIEGVTALGDLVAPGAAAGAAAGVALADPDGGPPSPATTSVLVGPEGGWSPAELSVARDAGVPLVRLSETVLRTETAAVAAGVLLCAIRSGIVAGVG